MPEWIKGQGFYYVQHTGPIDYEAIRKRTELLEQRLEEAERQIELRKELSAS